jgi:Gluconate 2-dehydrogenase subunit 3
VASGLTRRELVRGAAGGAFALAMPPTLLRPLGSHGLLTSEQMTTLSAAVARIVPASGPGDWSAADVGAQDYIARLLSGVAYIFAGGPYRAQFANFQTLSRVKRIGWSAEVKRLQGVYRAGLAQLDSMAGGSFASLPGPAQDAILEDLDLSGSEFFGALYNHTMEGVYAHPVYRGGNNMDYRAWTSFGYQGDVHGVRFPHRVYANDPSVNVGSGDDPWNVFGGYAPDEMAKPGTGR